MKWNWRTSIVKPLTRCQYNQLAIYSIPDSYIMKSSLIEHTGGASTVLGTSHAYLVGSSQQWPKEEITSISTWPKMKLRDYETCQRHVAAKWQNQVTNLGPANSQAILSLLPALLCLL